MKLLSGILMLMFLICRNSCLAQQEHFVYLQSDNGLPFYVKNRGQILSSSGAGYLIIPQLKDADLSFQVGFPKNDFPEQTFHLTVDKNAGYLVKNFGEKGWGLFNLQNLSLTMANAKPSGQNSQELETDKFSTMLATVVQDSTLLQKNLPPSNATAQVTPEPETSQPSQQPAKSAASVIGPDTSAIIASLQNDKSPSEPSPAVSVPSSPPENVGNSGVLSEPLQTTVVRRTMRIRTVDGLEMVYLDSTENGTDTVRLFMPVMTGVIVEKKELPKKDNNANENRSVAANVTPSVSIPVTRDESKPAAEKEPTSNENDSIGNSLPADSQVVKNENPIGPDTSYMAPPATMKGEKTIVQVEAEKELLKSDVSSEEAATNSSKMDSASTQPKVVTATSINSDCHDFASNDDFLRLRKKMAAENNKDEMLKVAKKVLGTKCFSTEQVKNLSFLFLSDQGKYEFFDAAYPFTSDSNEYKSLVSQLKDPYYVNRFKAMIHK